MSVLAIDFGTSRIKAAYWDEEKGEAVMLPLGNGGRLYIPSLFHVSRDGKIRFGEAAERELHHDPTGVLSSLKLELDKAYHYLPERNQVETSALMSLLFRQLIEHSVREVRGFNGNPPEKVVLTYPAKLDYEEIYSKALRDAGFNGEIVFIREPEAAGWAWVNDNKPDPGELLVVLDFGGGTVDWTCLRVDENHRPVMIPELRSDSMKAAGIDVDEGLFDEMMNRLGESQRDYVQKHRALVMEQICQMKESQNSKAMLSGDACQTLEMRLGTESFVFEPQLFADVVSRKVVNQALGRIEEYLKKVVEYQRKAGSKQFWCMLAGGTRLLSGLEEQVKKRVKEIAKACSMEVQFAEIAQADFATVRGAVLWQCQIQEATQPAETEAVMSATPPTEKPKYEEIKPNNARYHLPALAGIVVVLVAAFFMVTGMQKAGRSRDVEAKDSQIQPAVVVPENIKEKEVQGTAEIQKSQEEDERNKFVGTWQADVIENGIQVRIIWKISANGGSKYLFYTPNGVGTAFGDWRYSDKIIYEKVQNGSTASGSVEWINDDHFTLTIIDNGNEAYTGVVRNYYRN